MTASIPVGANPTAIAAGAGALWVASEEAGTVTRIEPRTGTVVRAIPVGNGPSALASGEGAVWVVNRHDGTLSRIDPATNTVTGTVRVGSDPTAVAAGDGAVWVAGGEDGTIARVEPGGAATRSRGSRPGAARRRSRSRAAGCGRRRSRRRPRTAAARCGSLSPRRRPKALSIDWMHERGYDFQAAQADLAGLRRPRRLPARRAAPPARRSSARSPPTLRRPEPRRPDLRLHAAAGAALLRRQARPPDDFRASMERFLRPVARADQFPPCFAGIVGAPRCMRRRAACDLSRGSRPIRRARTITIHLTRPDADFLHKLTHAVRLRRTGRQRRRHLTGDPRRRAPGRTGSHAGTPTGRDALSATRYFRSCPTRARPPGFADRIEVAVRGSASATTRGQIAAVQRGTADLAVLADPFETRWSAPSRLAPLCRSLAGPLHSAPTADHGLDVPQRAPAPVRRPSASAARSTSRSTARAWSRSPGGPEVGQPTCQFLPTGFPGYAAVLPVHRPAAAGAAGPRPTSRTRAACRPSGRAGERVVVRVPAYEREIGRYYTALLDELGFEASLRVMANDEYFRRSATLARGRRSASGAGSPTTSARRPSSPRPSRARAYRNRDRAPPTSHVCAIAN